jgi:hypothetical protein
MLFFLSIRVLRIMSWADFHFDVCCKVVLGKAGGYPSITRDPGFGTYFVQPHTIDVTRLLL